MGKTSRSELADLVNKALALADELELAEVGLRLDQALIALTGAGVVPRDSILHCLVSEGS